MHLVTGNEAGLTNDRVKDPLGSSDHNMIEFNIQFETEKLGSETTVFNLNKGNYNEMRIKLAKADWVDRSAGKTVRNQW